MSTLESDSEMTEVAATKISETEEGREEVLCHPLECNHQEAKSDE
jgi:hypothetical protein